MFLGAPLIFNGAPRNMQGTLEISWVTWQLWISQQIPTIDYSINIQLRMTHTLIEAWWCPQNMVKKFHSDHLTTTWMRAEWKFHRNWIDGEKIIHEIGPLDPSLAMAKAMSAHLLTPINARLSAVQVLVGYKGINLMFLGILKYSEYAFKERRQYSKWPKRSKFLVVLKLIKIAWLSKQSWGWWFEMPSRSLWCHNDYFVN